MLGESPKTGLKIQIKKQITANQMILYTPFDIELTESIIILNSEEQKKELYDLVNFVQPGFIREKTIQMGTYFGIYKDNRLIAASGERIKLNAFTEFSYVVTHPNCIRKGYAKQLIKQTTNKIFAEKKPILHLEENNIHAIKLYEQLGFTTRRKMDFCLVKAI